MTIIIFTIDTEHALGVEEELLGIFTLVTGPFSMPTVLIGCLTPLYGAPDTNTGFFLLSHKVEAELKIPFKDFRSSPVVFAFTVLIIGGYNPFPLDSYRLESTVASIDILL